MFAEGRELDAAFGDDKRAIRRNLDSVCVFACLGGLCEIIREKFMHVGFAISVAVAQPPDALRSKTNKSSPRTQRPSGSCNPDAKRRHTTSLKSPRSPEITQTSPSNVTAAARP